MYKIILNQSHHSPALGAGPIRFVTVVDVQTRELAHKAKSEWEAQTTSYSYYTAFIIQCTL